MAQAEKTFWEHLDELRGVLIRIFAVVAVLGVAAFIVMPSIFESVVMAPCRPDFPTYRIFDAIAGTDTAGGFSVDVVSIELASQFFVHTSAACWTAFTVGFPIIIYLLWGFISPALYEHEKRGIRGAFLFGNIMFYLGMAIGYFLIFPLALRFLADYRLSDAIRPIVSLDSYMDNFFTILLMMGGVFELPLLAMILGRMGLLTRGFFGRYRRHAIVVLLIVAALITPTGDPFTLFLVFIPIYALWEFSARLVPAEASDEDNNQSP